MKRRILFVAMQNSIHVARWITKLHDPSYDLHLFPVSADPAHELLSKITIHWPRVPVDIAQLIRVGRSSPFSLFRPAELLFGGNHVKHRFLQRRPTIRWPAQVQALFRGSKLTNGGYAVDYRSTVLLQNLISRLRPDLIHSMEFQHVGYRVLHARQHFKSPFPTWLATNWGSDIYYYRHSPHHLPLIKDLLSKIDFYSCECARDVGLARELGLTAPALPVMPNSGGFDLNELAQLGRNKKPSERRLVMVKGYQHFAGRAMTALDAIEQCSAALRDYEIIVFSSSYEVRDRVRAMAGSGWRIQAPGYLTHREMLRSFGMARIYLGVSVSDAISTSLLEAMAMGAFPIQTNTSCCDEWFQDGESGFSIPPDNLGTIAACLRRALTDDDLVDRAAEINWETVTDRLDDRELTIKVRQFYEAIFEDR